MRDLSSPIPLAASTATARKLTTIDQPRKCMYAGDSCAISTTGLRGPSRRPPKYIAHVNRPPIAPSPANTRLMIPNVLIAAGGRCTGGYGYGYGGGYGYGAPG